MTAVGLLAVVGAVAALTSFPAPPPNAVVYARHLVGSEGVALGVVPRNGSVLAQVSVIDGQGQGVRGLAVTIGSKRATSCGPGCYRATLRKRSVIDVRARGVRWNVALPTVWPAADATALVAHAENVWRALDSVSSVEDLSSDARTPLRSSWRMQAPDRVAYQVRGGWGGVVIGTQRWDRAPGAAKWERSPSTRLTQPVPGWVSVRNAHILGSGTFHGRSIWRVSFFDPGTPGWFTLSLDKKTLRTLDVWMIATSHFMHDVYGSFNTTRPILPPS